MNDGIPAHDAVIERRVLAAMLADDLAATVARESLTTDDFYMPKLQHVFLVMVRAIDENKPLDPALLAHEGIDRELLSEIIESAGSASAIESYIGKLRELSASRRAREGVARAMSETGSPGMIAERLRTVADSVEAKSPALVPDSVGEMYREMDEEVAGRRFAVGLPWPMISSEVIPLTPNSITILCGGPGATKSLMGIQIVRHVLALNHNAAMLELEKGASYHLRRCAAQMTGNSEITRASWCKANPSEVARIKQELKPKLDRLRSAILAPAAANGCTASELVSWVQSKARDHRVIGIDPITMMAKNAKAAWSDDDYFMRAVRRILERHQNSLLLVTHPRKAPPGFNRMQSSMDDLAGGQAYSRFADNILFLVAHEDKHDLIEHAHGSAEAEYNRTLLVCKARDGSATGRRFALKFDPQSLTLAEVGRIRRDK